MKRFSIISSLIFLWYICLSSPVFALIDSNGWVLSHDWGTLGQYYSADKEAKIYKDTFGSFSATKNQWDYDLRIRQEITVFKWYSDMLCPLDPTRDWQVDPFPWLTTNENLCYTCVDTDTYTADFRCWTNPTYDCIPSTQATCTMPAAGCVVNGCGGGDSSCTLYKRTCSSNPGGGPTWHILTKGWISKLFTAWNFPNEWGMNNTCSPWAPNLWLVVYNTQSKNYKWDEIGPTCERQAFWWLWWGYFIDTPALNKIRASGGGTDNTLIYQCSSADCGTLSGNTYTGAWTNYNVIGQWNCVDDQYGAWCKNTDLIVSPFLTHLQGTYSLASDLARLTDKAENTPNNDTSISTTDNCDSNVNQPYDIARSCYYTIEQGKIGAVMNNPANAASLNALKTYGTLNTYTTATWGDLYSMLVTMSGGVIPAVWTPAFWTSITNLREASRFLFCPWKNNYNNWGADTNNVCLHNLYNLDAGKCKYTPLYSSTSAHAPLIDKIKPTISITANIGWDSVKLLDQENNIWEANPIESFLAGTGVIAISILDKNNSNYSGNTSVPNWLDFNGISGLDSVTFSIDRTHDDKGVAITNINVMSGTFMLSGSTYNPKGLFTNAHVFNNTYTIPETLSSWFKKAGTYKIIVRIMDAAWNLNEEIVNFKVIPNDIEACTPGTISGSLSSTITIATPWLCPPKVASGLFSSITTGDTTDYKWSCGWSTGRCTASYKKPVVCGDGIKDKTELCDFKDATHAGWGTETPGCNNSCQPVNLPGPACDSSRTGPQSSSLSIGYCATADTPSGFIATGTNPINYSWSCGSVNCTASYIPPSSSSCTPGTTTGPQSSPVTASTSWLCPVGQDIGVFISNTVWLTTNYSWSCGWSPVGGLCAASFVPPNSCITNPVFPGCCPIYSEDSRCIIGATPFGKSISRLVDPSLGYYKSWTTIQPADIIYTISGTTIQPWSIWSNDAYANGMDSNLYVLHLGDKFLVNDVRFRNLYDFRLSSTGIYLDSVSKTWTSALWVDVWAGYMNTPQTVMTDTNGNIFFRIKSYTPWEYTEQYSYTYYAWDRFWAETGSLKSDTFPTAVTSTGEFFHIFTWSLELYTSNRIDLGTHNDVRLGIDATTTTQNPAITSFTVENFMESLVSLAPTLFQITDTGAGVAYNSGFSFTSKYPNPGHLSGAVSTFTPEQISTQFFDTLEVKTWPFITLPFVSGPIAKYYLTTTKDNYGSGIIFGTGVLNRIYVAGNKRSVGKEWYVDTSNSLGAVNSADLRNRIRKNVALLIRNRENPEDQIIGRFKYVKGDKKLSELMALPDKNDWDTLVIQWGNLIIDQNFNTGAIGAKLADLIHKGIIVFANDTRTAGGNIYITPNVSFIWWALFAEESVMSANSSWTPYTVSNSARTKDLSNQLVFYGGIYSKNTIWWAVLADVTTGKYILPWGTNITNVTLNDAVRYDLAFLRMANQWQNILLNGGRNEFVVILADTRNITDPLPGWK